MYLLPYMPAFPKGRSRQNFFAQSPQSPQVMSQVMSTEFPIQSDNGIEGIEQKSSISSIPSIPAQFHLNPWPNLKNKFPIINLRLEVKFGPKTNRTVPYPEMRDNQHNKIHINIKLQ